MNWWKPLKGRVKIKEPLKKHTTFGVGGPADFFIQPKDSSDLKLLLNLLKRGKMPFLLIGAGSNLLVSDKGVKAAVISLDSLFFKKINRKGDSLAVGSGARLGELLSASRRSGLSGLEFLAGIPGSLGGALVMNAGVSERTASGKAIQRSISDLVEEVTVMDRRGDIKKLKKKDIAFRYRTSSLGKYIVLSASFKLRRAAQPEVEMNINRYLEQRKRSQGKARGSAGCVFRNPKGDSAGRLIDLCGLKGKHIGGASVSAHHANFILNTAQASSGDILKLMQLIKRRVRHKFGVDLDPEIKIWQN